MEISLNQIARVAWISKMVAVVARLEIADHLVSGRKTPEELAETTGTNADGMRFLLRALASTGIFRQHEDGTFSNSTESDRLTDGHPESLRNYCMLLGEMYYEAWGGLLHTIETGVPASRHVFGGSIYDHMDAHPQDANVYDSAMQELARPVARQIATRDGFSSVRRVIDIGGGNGALLKEILEQNPHLEGVCVDRADTCARASEQLHRSRDEDLTQRLRFQPADFLSEVPGAGDIYVLKNVLHNWSPETSVKILDRVRASMIHGTSEDPSLLVVEPLIEHDREMSIRALFQMVICEEDTRERSETELRWEVEAAGLQVHSVEHLTTGHSVVECKLVD